jgi:uncharacterized membrane protein YhaH (DUF805 family)
MGQPAVYFAPPGENVHTAAPGPYYAAPEVPYDNGYAQYRSFRDQHSPEPVRHDPFGETPRDANPFLSLSARGARQKVTMIEAMILWLRNWNNFSGRASRSEYWWIRVVGMIARFLWWVMLIEFVQMGELSRANEAMHLVESVLLLVSFLIMLVLWVPTVSLTVRRLHDTDRGGWYFLLQFVPFGSLFLFRALRQDSDPAGFRFDDSTNRPYGVEDID